jgi:hypothetical protein
MPIENSEENLICYMKSLSVLDSVLFNYNIML